MKNGLINYIVAYYRDKDKTFKIDNTTKNIVVRIFEMYLEGKSYQTIANILNKEKVLYPEVKHWIDSSINGIINNKIYMGDYERYQYDNDRETELFMDVVLPIITRAMWEEVQKKGRNQDINVKDMSDYRDIKKQLAEKEKKLAKANKQTSKLDNTTKDINQILDNLKPAKFNKNNMVISNEDVEKIKNFTKDVKDTTKTVRSVNDLNVAIRDFEHSAFEI